jgi:hypothetical protein
MRRILGDELIDQPTQLGREFLVVLDLIGAIRPLIAQPMLFLKNPEYGVKARFGRAVHT